MPQTRPLTGKCNSEPVSHIVCRVGWLGNLTPCHCTCLSSCFERNSFVCAGSRYISTKIQPVRFKVYFQSCILHQLKQKIVQGQCHVIASLNIQPTLIVWSFEVCRAS